MNYDQQFSSNLTRLVIDTTQVYNVFKDYVNYKLSAILTLTDQHIVDMMKQLFEASDQTTYSYVMQIAQGPDLDKCGVNYLQLPPSVILNISEMYMQAAVSLRDLLHYYGLITTEEDPINPSGFTERFNYVVERIDPTSTVLVRISDKPSL